MHRWCYCICKGIMGRWPMLQYPQSSGLKINAEKIFFRWMETECLGCCADRKGIRPLTKKAQAIQNTQTPKTCKELHSFTRLTNCCRDMHWWQNHHLAPLTKLISSNVKFKWTDKHQKAFEAMKKMISREVLLAHPDFNEPFDIHDDASDYQLEAVISQEGKPIAFCSRKLN